MGQRDFHFQIPSSFPPCGFPHFIPHLYCVDLIRAGRFFHSLEGRKPLSVGVGLEGVVQGKLGENQGESRGPAKLLKINGIH